MNIINDGFRVWTGNQDMHPETVERLQEFIREYLLNVQQELCARIKQDFNVRVYAAGVIDGAK